MNESKVASLLASLDNLPDKEWLGGTIGVLLTIVKEQQRQIEELSKRLEEKASITVHGEYMANDVTELQLWFSGENHVFFQANRKNGSHIQTLCLKGEI